MKFKRNLFAAKRSGNPLLITSIILIFTFPSADAASLFWDGNGAAEGASLAPTGIWGTDPFWSTSNVGTAVPAITNTNPIDDLFFSAGTDAVNEYIITLNGTREARMLFIQEGTPTFSGGMMNLGSNGGITVDALAGDPTVNSDLAVIGSQTFNVGAGRTLNFVTGTFTRNRGATIIVRGEGALVSTLSGLETNTAGIVGPWAVFGLDSATQYASFDGSAIVGLTGTAATDGSELADNTGVVNYDLAAAGGTVPASVSANTIRYTGDAATTTPGASQFAVNGLMNVGSGIWAIDTNSLRIGNTQELVINPVTSGISIASAIEDNANGESALVKTGPGMLSLAGQNTYTGPTTVNSGVLDVGTIENGSLGTGGLHLVGGSVLQGNGEFARSLGNNSTPTNDQVAGGNGGFAARGGTLTVDFGGTLSLSGTSFSNRFGDNFVFGSPSADSPVVVVNDINLNGATRNITVNAGLGGDSAELAGVISTGFGLIKNGAGRLILSAVNTYTGTTTLNGGVLDVGTLNGEEESLGGGGLVFNNGAVLQGNGLFTRAASGMATAGPLQFTGLNGGFAARGGSLTLDFGGAAAEFALSQGSVRFGTNLVFGSSTADSPVTLINSPISLGGASRTFTVIPGVGGDYAEISGIIVGTTTNGITKNGAGRLLLSGANEYPGPTLLNLGTLHIANDTALGSITGTTTIASAAATLALSGGITVAEGMLINARNTGDQLLNISDENTLTGALSWFTGGTSYGIRSNAGKLTITGAFDPAGSSKTLNISGAGDVEIAGPIDDTDTGTFSIAKTGAGTLTLSSSNTFKGSTTVTAGTLVLTTATTLDNASTLNIASGAVVHLPNTGTDIVAALIIDGVAVNAGTYDSSNTGGGFTSGAITGLGRIQVGAGTADYSSWAATFGPGFTDTAADSDPDSDGLSNQQEYAFGLNPISGSSVNPISVSLDKATGLFTYTRRDPALTGLSYTVETSLNLTTWPPDQGAIQNVISTSDDVQTVQVTLSAGFPLPESRFFVRVSAD